LPERAKSSEPRRNVKINTIRRATRNAFFAREGKLKNL
jgi:hypothetical protein